MFSRLTMSGCRNQGQAYAIESQSYVLHCTTVLTEAGIEVMKTAGSPIMGTPNTGSSAVIAPDGRIISEPNPSNERLVIADIDLSLITKTKTFADATGHCTSALAIGKPVTLTLPTDSRPDMLWLGCDDRLKKAVRPVAEL